MDTCRPTRPAWQNGHLVQPRALNKWVVANHQVGLVCFAAKLTDAPESEAQAGAGGGGALPFHQHVVEGAGLTSPNPTRSGQEGAELKRELAEFGLLHFELFCSSSDQ